jgi:hypothetical protein
MEPFRALDARADLTLHRAEFYPDGNVWKNIVDDRGTVRGHEPTMRPVRQWIVTVRLRAGQMHAVSGPDVRRDGHGGVRSGGGARLALEAKARRSAGEHPGLIAVLRTQIEGVALRIPTPMPRTTPATRSRIAAGSSRRSCAHTRMNFPAAAISCRASSALSLHERSRARADRTSGVELPLYVPSSRASRPAHRRGFGGDDPARRVPRPEALNGRETKHPRRTGLPADS